MRKLRRILVSAVLLMGTMATIAATPNWEVVQTVASSPSDSEKVEISVRDGYIYVSTTKATTVKILSIVGQTISSQHLPAGVSRIKVPARGIYILKAGDTTMRVTI